MTTSSPPIVALVPRRSVSPRALALGSTAVIGILVTSAWALGPVSVRAAEVPFAFATAAVGAFVGLVGPCVATTPKIVRWARAAGDAAVATSAITVLLVLATLCTALATPWTGPLADAWLSAPERAIGLTQADVSAWASRIGILPILVVVYGSIFAQVKLASLYHVIVRPDADRLWSSAAAFGISTLIGLPIYLLLPAEGPSVLYATGEIPSFLGPWLAMRSGDPYTLVLLDGFVSSPSFHMVFCVLLLDLFRGTPLRIPALVWNAAMPLATLVIGFHYAVDLVLGVALGYAAIGIVRRLGRS